MKGNMLKIYNTLSGKKEILKPFDKAHGKKLRLFVCGPTVYDASHIGHARTYLAFDMIVKYLKSKGYDVFYLQNITDIDDKIINRAKEIKTSPLKLARHFEKDYLADMNALKINSVAKYARATDHIKEIISQTKRLLKKGVAYEIKGDGIYYDISKFKNYGKLAKRTVVGAESAISRIDESINKKNKGDFCLWKFSKAGEPKWPFDSSPRSSLRTGLPAGRPGWHIEDTAITEKFLGVQYDIHGGARDLIFPHHEAEIAQMEAISGKRPMVKYWLHTGFLTVNGQKMSKSLGNFITIKDFVNKYSARTLRFLMLKNHYRSPIDYSESSIAQAEKELERIDAFLDVRHPPKLRGMSDIPNIRKLKTAFEAAMEDDFNTPKAMAVIFEMIRRRKGSLEFFKQIDKFFNFIFWPKVEEKIPKDVLGLAEHREEYRKQKDWQRADELRKKIMEMGWLIEDTEKGPKLKRAK